MFWKKKSVALPDTEQDQLLQTKSKKSYSTILNIINFISVIYLLVLGVKYIRGSSSSSSSQSIHDDDLQWKELVPGSGIFHANITLPLDYGNPSSGNLTVALAKLPATVGEEEKLGSMLINPGGPGGSGTNFVYRKGQLISGVIDGQYDIIGFDPRGINWTTPQFFCATPEQKEINKLNQASPPLLTYHNGDDVSYGETYASTLLKGLICSSSDGGQYISTALVATDMLYISERLGDKKLNYWGFSYGTILGNTFAQLYPEKVGRMVVDGVSDAEDYYQGAWLKNLVNTDDVSDGFFQGCAASDNCAINGTTSDEIRDKVIGLLHRLQLQPHVVFDGENIGHIEYSDFKGAFFSALYVPSSWATFANLTNELISGNGTPFFETYVKSSGGSDGDDGGYATRCGDASNSPYLEGIKSVEDLKEHSSKLKEITSLWSDLWSLSCQEYKHKPVFVWDGPFQKVNASMLLVGNTYDPVTPLVAARKMSQFYTNGIVLHHDGYGHCSNAQRSSCTENAIKKWFLEGILPTNNTLCHVDEELFEGKLSVQEALLTPLLF